MLKKSLQAITFIFAAVFVGLLLAPSAGVAKKPSSNYAWFDYSVRPTERVAADDKTDPLDACYSQWVQSEVLIDPTGDKFTGSVAFEMAGRAVEGLPPPMSSPSIANVDIEVMVRVLEWQTFFDCPALEPPGEQCGKKPGTFTLELEFNPDLAPLLDTKRSLYALVEQNRFSSVTFPDCGREALTESEAAAKPFMIPKASLRKFFGLTGKERQACSRTSVKSLRPGCKADFSRNISVIDSSAFSTTESLLKVDFKLDGYCERGKACWSVGKKGFRKLVGPVSHEPPLPARPLTR